MSDSYKRTILVTGSNTGIGYELVRLLAEKGHIVYLASRNEASGKEAQAKLKKEYNLDVKFVQLDVTDLKSVQAAKDVIEKAEGKLDVLVHNAGISNMHQPQNLASSVALDLIRSAHETNFYGVIQTTQVFLPLILAAPPGHRVILLNSMHMGSNAWMAAKDKPNAGLHFVAYNTSKVAANSYMIALAHELKDKDVKVNAVGPGFVTTKLNGFAPGGKAPEGGAKVLLPYALLGPEDAEITNKFFDETGEMSW